MIHRKLMLLGTLALLGCDAQADGGAGRRVPAAIPLLAEEAAEPTAPAATTSGAICSVVEAGNVLPDAVRETSGLAQSRRTPGLFWTHNDSGTDADLFAIRLGGEVVGRVRVQGVALEDWEDLEAGPCESGACLFLADIGDNEGARQSITVYEVPEPDPSESRTAAPRTIRARYPDGPRDAESLFVLPSGDLFVVTKGRQGPIELYRFPSPRRPGETVTLERVRELAPHPENELDRVTSATATPDGRWVAVRSYRTLLLYPVVTLVGSGAAEPTRIDLGPLREIQGESVVLANDGTVWLTSEAENKKDKPSWGEMRCALPDIAG